MPGRDREFRDNIEAVVGIGGQLGCRASNALYGVRVDGVSPVAQDELAAENLALAASAAGRIGGTVLIEPVSGPKPYPLRTAADAIAVLDRVDSSHLGFLCDLYHLHTNGDDLDAVISAYGDRVAHVQIADAPGRGEPGSGSIDLDRYLGRLEQAGYAGWVSLEYHPSTPNTTESLAWLEKDQRSGP